MIEAQKPGKIRGLIHRIGLKLATLGLAVKIYAKSSPLTEGVRTDPPIAKPKDTKTDDLGRNWDCTLDSHPMGKPLTSGEKKFQDDALTAASITYGITGGYVSPFSLAGLQINVWNPKTGHRIGEDSVMTEFDPSTKK